MTHNWELDHIGIVVRDVKNAIEYYQRINKEFSTQPVLKPFEGTLFTPDKITTAEGTIQFKAGFVQNNSVRIECIQL